MYKRRPGPNWWLIGSLVLVGGVVLALLADRSEGLVRLPLSAAVPFRAAPPPTPTPEPTPLPPRPVETAGPHVQRGDAAMAQGRWALAVEAYAEALRIDPRLATVLAREARALLYLNRYAQALERAERAVELEPRNVEAQTVHALALDFGGQAERAINVARRATELDPKSVEAQAVLAEALIDKYRLREAEEALDRADALERDHPATLRVRAYLLETKADYAGAVTLYMKAIEALPNRSYLYLSLGHALRALKRYDQALGAFTTAAELAPTDPRAQGGLGMVYYALEEYETALAHLQKAVQIDPRYANGHAQMGWAYYVQRDYEKALPAFQRAIELETDRGRVAQYRHALGWIYLNTGQKATARDQFAQALQLNPELQGARDGLELADKP